MKRQYFKCKLLSDIVMTASSSTQILKKGLDYIPGSKFLGIVANELYRTGDNPENVSDFLYNGVVRYSDAHPCVNGKMSLQLPSSWNYIKGKKLEEELHIHHHTPKEKHIALTKAGKQLKQVRAGYFLIDGYLNLKQNFAIKSAYDRTTLRSEDEKMYGYYSLEKGTEWIFHIDDYSESGNYLNSIRKYFSKDSYRIGKSKSAQYGLVRIEEYNEIKTEVQNDKDDILEKGSTIYLYAKSNLCFYSEHGRNTLKPNPISFSSKFEEKDFTINWDDSQIRHRLYQTWNRKRQNRDADRQIIMKGSVIAIQLNENIDASYFYNGVGSHLNEGFGQVIINPLFLEKDYSQPSELKNDQTKIEKDISYFKDESPKDQLILNYIQSNLNEKNNSITIDERANQFKANHESRFSGLNSSQWGIIRNYAKNINDYTEFKKLVFGKISGFTESGQSKKDWDKKARRTKLIEEIEKINDSMKIDFILKLSAVMAKVSKKN